MKYGQKRLQEKKRELSRKMIVRNLRHDIKNLKKNLCELEK